MSWGSREVLLVTRILCSGGGSMKLPQLHQELLQLRGDVSEEDFCGLILRCPRFLLVPSPPPDGWLPAEDCTVVAKTSVRLCRRYGREEPCGACQELHLCKFFIYGTCRFGKGRKPCKFSHDIRSDHNYRLLRECSLHELTEDDLFLLLLHSDPALLPEVCSHYNKGPGPHGSCTYQSSCTKVHLCQHFVKGDCMFGRRCRKQHAIDEHGHRMLEKRGLSGDVIHNLPVIYRNVHHLSAAAAAQNNISDSFCKSAQTDQTMDICLHFIRNSCRFLNDCHRVHFHLPYKWEVFDGDSWTDLPNMEDIERDFCDPSNTQSGGECPVNFLTMTQGLLPVRRLSTVSSVMKPSHYSLTTEWLWYYKKDRGTWVEYGQPDEKRHSTSVTSRTLEEAFLSDQAEVSVVKGQRRYVICFRDMYQRNLKHNTKRKVCRRPRFISWAEVQNQLSQ